MADIIMQYPAMAVALITRQDNNAEITQQITINQKHYYG